MTPIDPERLPAEVAELREDHVVVHSTDYQFIEVRDISTPRRWQPNRTSIRFSSLKNYPYQSPVTLVPSDLKLAGDIPSKIIIQENSEWNIYDSTHLWQSSEDLRTLLNKIRSDMNIYTSSRRRGDEMTRRRYEEALSTKTDGTVLLSSTDADD